jgi:hypothetical protein
MVERKSKGRWPVNLDEIEKVYEFDKVGLQLVTIATNKMVIW